MEEEIKGNKEPGPERLSLLRRLPKETLESLTKEELKAFLYEDVWPDSLGEKLKDYLVDV